MERIERAGGKVHRGGPARPVDAVLLPPGATDADLAGLCELPGLAFLVLRDTQVTDDGLGAVAGLPRLRRLRLSGATITDGGLRRLEALTGRRCLELGGCPNVSDEGVERLRQALPDCQVYR